MAMAGAKARLARPIRSNAMPLRPSCLHAAAFAKYTRWRAPELTSAGSVEPWTALRASASGFGPGLRCSPSCRAVGPICSPCGFSLHLAQCDHQLIKIASLGDHAALTKSRSLDRSSRCESLRAPRSGSRTSMSSRWRDLTGRTTWHEPSGTQFGRSRCAPSSLPRPSRPSPSSAARSDTSLMSSPGFTGLTRCMSKPARSVSRRSSRCP